jgi:transcription antitermination factor NusA-like protein
MNEIWQNVLSFLGGGVVVVGVAIWAIQNLDKLERLAACFLRTFSWISKKLEYANVATNLQSKVNTYGEKISKEVPEALPHAMKIEWARDSRSVEASLRNGEVVVTLDYSVNLERNLVVSTLAYLGKGLLPNARMYIDPTLIKATDFTVAKGIFVSSGQSFSTQYFFDHYLMPEVNSSPQLLKDCQALDLLQDRGFFTRIYLKQLKILGDKVYPATPDTQITKESRDFIDFLHRIASKQRGVDVPGGLTFTGSTIRISVMLVARTQTLIRSGIHAFERRIALCRNAGIEYLYICGIGSNNIYLADYIANQQKSAGTLLILDSQRFRRTVEDKDFNAICILCRLSLAASSETFGDIHTIVNVLQEYIKEIEDGIIEIVYIARSPGVKSKIVVNSQVEGIDPIVLCTDQTKLTGMQFALGGEALDFVKWSDQPEDLIVSSLTPLEREQVAEIVIEPNQNTAIIKVQDERAKSLALGYGDLNLKMAMELTGYHIVVEVAGQETVEPNL